MQQQQQPSSTPQEELDLLDDIDHLSDNTFSPHLTNRNNAGKWPKPALRQPYTSSKLSVSSRRVRFELGDSEVLPTTSPEASKPLFPQVAYTQTNDEEHVSHSAFDDNGECQKPVSRKKSSSEALRALSKAPFEEGTVWTVVQCNVEPFLGQEDAHSTKESLANVLAPEYQGFGAPVSSVNEDHEKERGSDYEDSSGDEFLAMAKTRKYPTIPVPVSDGTTRSSSYLMPLDEAELEEEDQIFSFEPDGGFTT